MSIIHSLIDAFHRLTHTSVIRGQDSSLVIGGCGLPTILFRRFLDTKAANSRVTSLLISEWYLVAARIEWWLVAAEIVGEGEEEAESGQRGQ